MRHPCEAIPPGRRLRIFLPLLAATLVMTALLRSIDQPLQELAPGGILGFELAGSVERAAAILAAWQAAPAGPAWAGLGLGLDFMYMAIYAITISLACIGVAGLLQARHWPGAGLGRWLAWGAWVAAVCDAIENYSLLQTLLHGPAAPWPQIAALCALAKFALIILALLYTLTGGIAWLIGAAMRQNETEAHTHP